MSALPKYERYKDSGIEWADTIPSHWDVKPGRVTLSLNKEKNAGNIEETVLSLSYGRLVIKPPEKMTGLVPESLEGYQIINPGDIIIRPTDLQNDWTSLRVGLAKDRGIITSAYLGLKHDDKISSEYLYYLLHSYDLLKVYYGMGTGLRQNLSWDDFKYLPLTLPPKPEQDRIVAFLDQKTAEIDALIAKKQRQIELLDEQKAILINRSVTQGLNPNSKLKPSGIEWIGEIPEHWSITRFKFCATSLEQGWSPQCENRHAEAGSWGVVKVGCVNGGVFKPEEHKALPPALKADIRFLVTKGDFLVSRANSRELVGSAAIATDSVWRLMLCDKVYRCRISNQKFVPDLVVSLFGIKSSRIQLEIGANGASDSMQNISQDIVKNLWLPLPPLSEQVEIVAYIRDLSTQKLRVKLKVESQIKSLKSLRSTLIAHAVTGRIKV
ncbi:MAG: restriction endonuclease subunit S [Verrucomicrobiota bacterium]